MLGSVDLELTNFIDPDLTWKTVKKGSRSSSRRSRRPTGRSLNIGMQLDDKSPKGVEDSSVSEPEKLGVAVLGRRFADKVEHVPIKKRRLLLRSPSPPHQTPLAQHEEPLSPRSQTPSHPEEPKRLLDDNCASDRWWYSNSVSKQKMGAFDGSIAVQLRQDVDGGVMIGKLEDFSGIALLAAAACNNSIGVDVDHAKEGEVVEEILPQEGNESSLSARPLKETITSSEEVNLQTGSVYEDNMDGSFVHDNSVSVSRNEDDGEVKCSVPSKDGRLHWDLNTVMDAWEQPCADLTIHSQRNASEGVSGDGGHIEKLENLDSCEKQRVVDDSQNDIESKVQSKVCETVSAQFEACSGAERTCCEEKSVSASIEHALAPLKYASADTQALTQVVSTDTSLDKFSCSVSDHISSSACVSEEKINATPICVVKQIKEDCCRTTMQLGEIVSSEGVQLGKLDGHFPDVPVSEKAMCEIDSIPCKDGGGDSGKTSGLLDNRTSPKEEISITTCQTLDVDSLSKSDKIGPSGPSHPSPKCENSSALGTSDVEGLPVASLDLKEQDDNASAAGTSLNGYALCLEPKELPESCRKVVVLSHESCKPYDNGPGIEDPSDDCYNSDVSPDGRGNMVDVDMTELQTGYDSPFEDGELREATAYSWEENEVEGETEFVDYESDNGVTEDFDAAGFTMSEKVEVEDCGTGAPLKEPSRSASLNTKFSGRDQLPEGRECSTDRTGEVNDVSLQKIHTSDCIDGLDVKGFSMAEVKSRASRGKLSSQVEGTSCSDEIQGKGAVFIPRSRNIEGSYYRPEREFDSEKFLGRDRSMLQMHDRSQDDGHWVDSSAGYWDSRNRYSTNSHVPHGPGHARRRSLIANMAAKVEGLPRDHRRPINYSSRGGYRPPMRRSPTDRDDGYGVHRRMLPMRDINRSRSGDRSVILRQGVSRGLRGEYNRPGFDDPASSVRVPHYVARRERSFSPIPSRGAHFPRSRRKSRSRSRTRSPPLAWHLQRERNVGGRCDSRSPDFRSEGRMKRMRIPFQKSSFPAYEEESFMPLPGGRISPKYNSRLMNDRNSVGDHFRDRSPPPVRQFQRRQRFDLVGDSPGRVKSDNYFRPMVRRGRFSGMSGSPGRGHKFDGSDDDRRKPGGERYEEMMIRRVRRYDNGGGVVRRFHYEKEECFEAHNNNNNNNNHNEDECITTTTRTTGRRMYIRNNGREERGGGTMRYNNNENSRMYIGSPKSSGIRDFEEDASPPRKG
ncbi:uncharacterized protein LOC132312672 [Cornus florida]|uniref:uncharacterized protein LOC132312672 n=1 Tax=Cornus florida TaxID=4283 RepID=UPI00289EA830|nr:uncharacterized protein LOC132312672 [Cornus florida]